MCAAPKPSHQHRIIFLCCFPSPKLLFIIICCCLIDFSNIVCRTNVLERWNGREASEGERDRESERLMHTDRIAIQKERLKSQNCGAFKIDFIVIYAQKQALQSAIA